MSKHTDEAARAADVIIELACNVGAAANKQKHLPFPSRGKKWGRHILATIIDQKMGLSELKACIKSLEADKAVLKRTVAGLREMQDVKSYLQLEAEKAELVAERDRLTAEKAKLWEVLALVTHRFERWKVGAKWNDNSDLPDDDVLNDAQVTVADKLVYPVAKVKPESGEKEKQDDKG